MFMFAKENDAVAKKSNIENNLTLTAVKLCNLVYCCSLIEL